MRLSRERLREREREREPAAKMKGVAVRSKVVVKGVAAQARPSALHARGRPRRGDLQVSCALTKEKKQEVVSKLKSELETSTAVVGFTFKGVTVPDLEKLRGDMPDDASLVIAKNTLMKRAANEVEGWSEMSQFCTGSNAFLFLREDLKGGFKGLRDLQDSYKKSDNPVDLNGGCCDGEYLTLEDIKVLEKLPSKLELIAKIASCINQGKAENHHHHHNHHNHCCCCMHASTRYFFSLKHF